MANELTAKAKSEVAEAKAEANIEKLSNDMATLKADLAQIVGTLKDLGIQSKNSAVEGGRRHLLAARDEVSGQVDHLRVAADDYQRQAIESVRERPGQALLIAAAVGAVFGFLTARK